MAKIPIAKSPLKFSVKLKNCRLIHIKNCVNARIKLEVESNMYDTTSIPIHARSNKCALNCVVSGRLNICAMRKMLRVYNIAPKKISDPPIL